MDDYTNTATVLRTLVYYDIFNYPLSIDDVILNCHLHNEEKSTCVNLLNQMVKEGIVYFIDGYYSLRNEPDNVIARVEVNGNVDKWMSKARRISAFISRIPYVRGVGLSGLSLKKSDSDFSFFIITSPGRLWISRTLVFMFEKIFIQKTSKKFNTNYFTTTEDLEIDEKNIFMASELVTMVMLFGKEVNNSLIRTNRWVRKFYPNFTEHDYSYPQDQNTGFGKQIFESIFNNRLGDKLNTMLMNFTIRRWRRKYKSKMTDEEMNLVFSSSTIISKCHPWDIQKHVLDEYLKRKKFLENKYNIQIDSPFYITN